MHLYYYYYDLRFRKNRERFRSFETVSIVIHAQVI